MALYDQYRKAEGDAEAARELELDDDLKAARASMERLEADLQKALLRVIKKISGALDNVPKSHPVQNIDGSISSRGIVAPSPGKR